MRHVPLAGGRPQRYRDQVSADRAAGPPHVSDGRAGAGDGDRPAGKQFTGELLQQDPFDVTIRTADGVQRSWPSRSVKIDTTDKLAKHLELLSKHSNADMHNLFAYLVTLQ